VADQAHHPPTPLTINCRSLLCGSIPMVITGYFLSRVMGSPATGNLTSGLITPLLSHAAGGRRPAARYV
jgi:hypothetical protein